MVTGTLINYFVVCKTKLWLFAHRIGLEENSEDVRIGRVLHEIDEKGDEVAFEGFKLDKITKDYVIELKKSDSDIEAAKWQLLYYLWRLEKKGIEKKGRIEVFEKRGSKKRFEVVLDEDAKANLVQMIEEIEKIISQEKPPPPKPMQKCRKCAYYSYCFI